MIDKLQRGKVLVSLVNFRHIAAEYVYMRYSSNIRLKTNQYLLMEP